MGILYACDNCQEFAEQVSAAPSPRAVRVVDGEWLCAGCYDAIKKPDGPEWGSLPVPPPYGPLDKPARQ